LTWRFRFLPLLDLEAPKSEVEVEIFGFFPGAEEVLLHDIVDLIHESGSPCGVSDIVLSSDEVSDHLVAILVAFAGFFEGREIFGLKAKAVVHPDSREILAGHLLEDHGQVVFQLVPAG